MQADGELARAVQVAHAEVVGGQRQPEAVRLRDLVGQFVHQVGEVAGAGEDALARVEAVARRRMRSAVSSVSIIMPRTPV